MKGDKAYQLPKGSETGCTEKHKGRQRKKPTNEERCIESTPNTSAGGRVHKTPKSKLVALLYMKHSELVGSFSKFVSHTDAVWHRFTRMSL